MVEPLVLTRSQAAELCQLTVTGFDSWVRRGIVPGPIKGTKRWSRAALERAIAGGDITTPPSRAAEDDDDPEAAMARWMEQQHASHAQGH